MRRTFWGWLVAAFSLTLIGVARGDPSPYTVIDLGTLGGTPIQPTAINAEGQVTGVAYLLDGDRHAFLFSDGLLTDLGTLGGRNSVALSINSAGEVTGYADTPDGNFYHAFLSSNGVMTDLGALGTTSMGRAVNDLGQVAGGVQTSSGTRAFLYSDGAMNTLGTLGGSYSEAWAINAAGEVVGAASSTQAGSRPFLYRNGMMQDLGTLDRSASSNGAAFAINAAGHVTGWSQAADGRLHPFLYGDGVMTDLGSLGGQLASGTSINSSDQVTGWAQAANGEYRAFLYSNGVLTDLGPCGCGVGAVLAINSLGQVVGFGDSLYSDGVTRNLNTLIPSGSNWSLDIAVAINDKGQITGEGNHADEPRAFLMTPVIRVPRTKDECKKGGWADLARAIGTAFKNQGDCVSYVNTGK